MVSLLKCWLIYYELAENRYVRGSPVLPLSGQQTFVSLLHLLYLIGLIFGWSLVGLWLVLANCFAKTLLVSTNLLRHFFSRFDLKREK